MLLNRAALQDALSDGTRLFFGGANTVGAAQQDDPLVLKEDMGR